MEWKLTPLTDGTVSQLHGSPFLHLLRSRGNNRVERIDTPRIVQSRRTRSSPSHPCKLSIISKRSTDRHSSVHGDLHIHLDIHINPLIRRCLIVSIDHMQPNLRCPSLRSSSVSGKIITLDMAYFISGTIIPDHPGSSTFMTSPTPTFPSSSPSPSSSRSSIIPIE